MIQAESYIETRPDRSEIRRGAVAIMPLWLGAAPFAFAYAVLARTGGLSVLETCLMSVIVSAGAAQLAVVTMVAENGGSLSILGTVLFLNLRHILYGLSLNEVLPAHPRPRRFALAHFISDETYGLTIRDYLNGKSSPGFLFGAGISLFSSFVAATFLGAASGRLIPDPEQLGLDYVFPLSFLAMLLPLIRHRTDLLVALTAGVVALGLSRITNGGLTILGSTILAASLGALLRVRKDHAS